jgi:NAD(P)-dependent dehydrogenase (short-subunit alcohol dehydrogenase family)
MDVNLSGHVLTIKHAGAKMAGRGGRDLVDSPDPSSGPVLRVEPASNADRRHGRAGPLGIRCRGPSRPRAQEWPIRSCRIRHLDDIDKIPLGAGRVDDAVRYLAGPESDWVTGQCLAVDGGHSLRRGPRIETMIERFFGADVMQGMDSRRLPPRR